MLSLLPPIPVQNNLFPPKSNPYPPATLVRLQSIRRKLLPLNKFRRLAATEEKAVGQREAENAGDSSVGGKLPVGLVKGLIPRHVAVIMDGNARWARRRGLPASSGHEAGVRSIKKMVELCNRWGIRVLTVFAFSYDNWVRPKVEVDFLMRLFERGIRSELDSLVRDGIKISVIGDSSKLPDSLKKLVADAEETTKNNSQLQLIVAFSYSGRHDIVQACQSISRKVKDNLIQPEDIDVALIEQELQTNCTEFPYPDLLIRTSGEKRVSNFLLWQLAYCELVFVEALWPDFGEAEFVDALKSFQLRQRRFGGR